MIDEMKATLDRLAADIETVDNAYTSARARNYISFSDDSTGFKDQIDLVHSLLYSVLILIAVLACVLLWKILSDKEKEV